MTHEYGKMEVSAIGSATRHIATWCEGDGQRKVIEEPPIHYDEGLGDSIIYRRGNSTIRPTEKKELEGGEAVVRRSERSWIWC